VLQPRVFIAFSVRERLEGRVGGEVEFVDGAVVGAFGDGVQESGEATAGRVGVNAQARDPDDGFVSHPDALREDEAVHERGLFGVGVQIGGGDEAVFAAAVKAERGEAGAESSGAFAFGQGGEGGVFGEAQLEVQGLHAGVIGVLWGAVDHDASKSTQPRVLGCWVSLTCHGSRFVHCAHDTGFGG
jgi:hypothetical protein